jgi:hypothetical protein
MNVLFDYGPIGNLLSTTNTNLVSLYLSPLDNPTGVAQHIHNQLKSVGEVPKIIDWSTDPISLDGDASVHILHGTLKLVITGRTIRIQQFRGLIHDQLQKNKRVIILCDIDKDRLQPIDGSDLLLDCATIAVSPEVRREIRDRWRNPLFSSQIKESALQSLLRETGLSSFGKLDTVGLRKYWSTLIGLAADSLGPASIDILRKSVTAIDEPTLYPVTPCAEALLTALRWAKSHFGKYFDSTIDQINQFFDSNGHVPVNAGKFFEEFWKLEHVIRRHIVESCFKNQKKIESFFDPPMTERIKSRLPNNALSQGPENSVLALLTLDELIYLAIKIVKSDMGTSRTSLVPILEKIRIDLVQIRNRLVHFRAHILVVSDLELVRSNRISLEKLLSQETLGLLDF